MHEFHLIFLAGSTITRQQRIHYCVVLRVIAVKYGFLMLQGTDVRPARLGPKYTPKCKDFCGYTPKCKDFCCGNKYTPKCKDFCGNNVNNVM